MKLHFKELRFREVFKHITNKFVLLVVLSLIMTMYMSKPASSLIMVEYKLGNISYGIDSRPRDITVGGPPDSEGGYPWIAFTEQFPGRIGVIDRSSGAGDVITELLLPQISGQNAEPWGIAIERLSNLIFFTDTRLNYIGQITFSASPLFTRYTIPTSSSEPRGIFLQENTTGTYVWFTEYQTGKIGVLGPTGATPNIVEWQLPDSNCQPNDIVVVGDTVYFTELGRNRIGSYNMSGGRPPGQYIKEFTLASGSAPWGLTADSDGMIWFTCSGRNVIGVLNPYTGEVTEHKSIPTTDSQPHGIAVDDVTGNVWFTEYQGHKITKYVPNENLFYEYATLTPGSAPNDVVVQRYNGVSPSPPPDNHTLTGVSDVWFTEFAGNRIGLISQAGPLGNFGTTWGATSTTTVTTVTSAVSGTGTAASSTTSTTRKVAVVATTDTPPLGGVVKVTASTTNATTQTQTETLYRLSTSTLGTSTSLIVEVAYTSITSTYTSTTYVSTVSVTSSTTSTSTSTSYIGTTSVTSTSTSWATVFTGTVTRTSTSIVSIPNTLTTTVTQNKYKTTTSATTSTTSTSTVSIGSTQTAFTTIPTTTTATTTSSRTTTTYTIPPFPELPGGIPGYPIESILVGIGLAATFLVIMSRRKRSQA
jgi:streptogramin lyase